MRYGSLWVFLLASSFGLAMHPARAQDCRTETRLAAFGGPAFFTSALPRPYEMAMSADATLFPLLHGAVGSGVLVEGGVYHPALSGTGNYYFSADALLTRVQSAWVSDAMRVRPFVVAGYTRFFNATGSATSGSSGTSGTGSAATGPSGSLTTSNAANLGIGVDRVINDDLWLRVEIRENYTPDGGSHALVLRIGIVAVGSLQ
jgi:hypothetical protein